jgi:lipopolysaccharide export system protein LptC
VSSAHQSARERVLEGLNRQRTDAAAFGPRRRRSVALAKLVLPVVAAALLVVLAIAPNLRLGTATNRVVYHPQIGHDVQSSMQHAQYHGVDQRGRPFTLTADEALQRSADDVELARPEGDITLNSGSWLMLRSDRGRFNQGTDTLALSGNVTLYRNDGTVMTGQKVDINLHEGSASSSEPVAAQGPFGTLTAAGGFNLTGRGTDVVFNGPASLMLNGAAVPAGSPASARSLQ